MCTSDDDDEILGFIDQGDIVEVAEANGSFTTLVAALKASGLDAVLADESRDFTVFAPTDAAFTAALANLGITAADLLASPNLADILLYHVVADAEINSTAAIAAAGTEKHVYAGIRISRRPVCRAKRASATKGRQAPTRSAR